MARKFKVGDRVRDEDFGIGTVKSDNGKDSWCYTVEFDEPTGADASYCKENHGLWLGDEHLTLIEE